MLIIKAASSFCLQGLSPGFREEYIISKNWDGTQLGTLYIEMACNHMFGNGDGDMIKPPNPNTYWRLDRAQVAVFNRNLWKLREDLDIMYNISNKLGEGSHIGMQAMCAANEIVNYLRVDNFTAAQAVVEEFFKDKPGGKVHNIYAMGHCHIDTAWLWPYDETIRKCARSFSAQLRLMEEYPNFTFVCSSAQQYAWVKEYFPGLFNEMKAKIADGHFIPVGGTWLENDGYMPRLAKENLIQLKICTRTSLKSANQKNNKNLLISTFHFSVENHSFVNFTTDSDSSAKSSTTHARSSGFPTHLATLPRSHK